MNIGNNVCIANNSKIDDSVEIMNNVTIYEDVEIGKNVYIGNNVVIHSGTKISDNTKILDNCVLSRIPIGTSSIKRILSDDLGCLIIGRNCVIGVNAVVYKGSKIGNRVLISDNASIREQCEIEDEVIIGRSTTVNYNAKIGKRTKIMDLAVITGNAIIENDVFISTNVLTTNDNYMGRKGYGDNHILGPIIKKYSTIGAGASILPGVIIGENCIVGSGSVVTRSVTDRKVVMGVPARVVKDVDSNLLLDDM
jgi:acetyltransferase-like isoleucine patch superfamily enzyme